MLIVIPSKSRATKQITWGSLPSEIRKKTFIAVGAEEFNTYDSLYPGRVLNMGDRRGIGAVREELCNLARLSRETKILMLDDDLTFAMRREDDPTKFSKPLDRDIINAIDDVDRLLHSYAHVAIAPREGANRRIDTYIKNTRALRALAYRVDILADNQIHFNEAELMEDFTVQLRLLTLGYAHYTINWMVQNQAGSNVSGGCSTYRTMESQSKAARTLAEKFPDFVKVVQKQTKVAWGGQSREDVIISWKAAYEYGRSRKGR